MSISISKVGDVFFEINRHYIHTRTTLYLCCIIIGLISFNSSALSETQSNIFSTWEGFEVDKCASIWLIKRYINRNAEIQFFKKGSLISKGTPFDTPNAILRRYHNCSTFEKMLNHYKLHDPKLVYIGKIVHDIEINTWEKKLFSETNMVKDDILKIIMKSNDNDIIIEESCRYLDAFYHKLNK